MSFFFHKIVAIRLSRFQGGVLLLLGLAVLCLVLGLFAPPQMIPVFADVDGDLPLDALCGMIIALDPGHGGYDGGTRAMDSGIWEKDLTLQITLKAEEALRAHGAKVVLTRREDVSLRVGDTATLTRKRQDLQARVNIAMEAEADVLLSIHLNEYRSRAESGPQVFYQRGGDAGRLLSGVLQKALIEELRPRKERVAMAGDYFVLRSAIPSALVECGFLSNSEDEKLLLDEGYQRQIGIALAKGLYEYKELLERLR